MDSKKKADFIDVDNSQQLNAFAKMMVLSFLWHSAGLLESEKSLKTEENSCKQQRCDRCIPIPEKILDREIDDC